MLVAGRVRESLRETILLDARPLTVCISGGIAVSESGDESTDELLRNAGLAMYTAKTRGAGCHAIFEAQMHQMLLGRVELERDLRRAVEHDLQRGAFVLHYQPIVRLDTRRVTGFEALVRWQHPVRGLLGPAEFITLAEDIGVIVPLGRWILQEACRRIAPLHTDLDVRMTVMVNVSGRQLQHPDFVGHVLEALETTGIEPHTLTLEMTESVMMQNTDWMLARLCELKRLGIRLAIDDFGTGYSSLSRLQQFPMDVLKIDKAFVDRVTGSREESAVARAVINLSQALQLSTIAEGVEQRAQAANLQALGCECGQGLYFGRPLPEDQPSVICLRSEGLDEPRRRAAFFSATSVLSPSP